MLQRTHSEEVIDPLLQEFFPNKIGGEGSPCCKDSFRRDIDPLLFSNGSETVLMVQVLIYTSESESISEQLKITFAVLVKNC